MVHGNLLSASSPAAGVTWSRDARNLPTGVSRTNNVSSAYSFDALGRLLSLSHSNGPTALNIQTYAYDAVGRRTSATNDLAAPLITQAASASVDLANELVSFGQTSYTQDLNGNRLTETSSSGTLTYPWGGIGR